MEISHKCKECGIKEIIISSLIVTENIDPNQSGKTILANNFIYCINN